MLVHLYRVAHWVNQRQYHRWRSKPGDVDTRLALRSDLVIEVCDGVFKVLKDRLAPVGVIHEKRDRRGRPPKEC